MDKKAKSTRMISLAVLHEMHTGFLLSALDGISDKDSHERKGTKANHIAWLTGSIVEQRFEIAGLLRGNNDKQKAHDLFSENKGIQDNVTYPSLEDFKTDWKRISPKSTAALLNVTDEKLDELFEMMPEMKMTNYELVSFMIYREANIIGQIALWRRLLGYDAMKYM